VKGLDCSLKTFKENIIICKYIKRFFDMISNTIK